MNIRILLSTTVLLCFIIVALRGYPMSKVLKPASFEHGQTIMVKSFKVDSDGGSFEVNNTGTVIDGTAIEVPKGSLEKDVMLSVGYNNGILDLRSGKSSGVVIALSAGTLTSFQKQITIKVRFDPSLNPKTIVGYEIDSQGRLHSLDIGSIEKHLGIVSFYSFKPLMFTWVYIY